MKKMIRWLVIAPLVLILAGVLFSWLFLDGLVKSGIEAGGSKVVGAKVELDSVDIGLFPIELALNRLQVTNPKEPMRNAVEAGNIHFGMELGPLFSGKVIISDASLTGLSFNTERSSSGALEKVPESPESEESFSLPLPNVDVPDVNETLKKKEGELLTLQRADQLEKQMNAAQTKWQEKKQALPDSKKIDSFKQRFQTIREKVKSKELSYLDAAKQLDQLKKDMDGDVKILQAARDEFQNDLKQLKGDLKALKNAPKEDKERLMKELGFSDGKGLEGIARALFGEQIMGWYDQAMYWYGVLEPYMSSGEGEEEEAEPEEVSVDGEPSLPDFWLQNLALSGQQTVSSGSQFNYQGSIKDITTDQRLINKVTEGVINMNASDNSRYEIKMTSDHRSEAEERVTLTGKQIKVANLSLASDKLPVVLKQANIDLNGNGSIKQGNLDMNLNALFNGSAFQVDLGDSSSEIKKILADGIRKVSQFNVALDIKGKLDDPKVSISSNIADPIKAELKHKIDEKKAQLEAKLQAKLEQKWQEKNTQLQAKLDNLLGESNSLESASNTLDQVKQDRDGYKKELEDKAKSKVEDKVQDKLNKLFK